MRSFSRIVTGFLPVCASLIPLACAGTEPPPYPPPAAVVPVQTPLPTKPLPPPPAAREDGRLPTTVTPLRVGLTLAIDPTHERFSGSERMVVKATEPTYHVVLNAHALHIQQASVVVKGERFEGITAARKSHGGFEPEELVVTFDPPIPPGEAQLDLTWDAAYSPNLMGLSREQDDGRWYAFTDLEPTHARNVFPSFDEPSFKLPYDVSVVVPQGMRAFANGKETDHKDDAGGKTTTFTFAPTPPLPSYLVAVAVGDLDAEPATEGSSPTPLRLLATKGKGKLGALSLEAGAQLTKSLGDYFGIAYPYGKLDLVAVPDFAPGAMENAGLITFREVLLLVDPKHSAAAVRRRQEQTIAHELAHQWFGDLVTLAWWNDSWLNEGFARWAQTKAIERARPESHATLDRLAGTDDVMNLDALGSARAVRQPVRSSAEAMESFDRITYDKGAAVLGMIESWVGEDTFRRAIHDYLTAHAWGNATAADLFAALEKGSGKPAGAVSAVASSFVDRTGVPDVEVRLACDRTKKSWSVELSESTWKPLGSAAPARDASWTIPACVRVAGQPDTSCVELSGASPKKTVEGSGACPAYVAPNAGMKGYYRSSFTPANARALAKAARSLDTATRVGLLSDTWAQVRSGQLPVTTLLEILPLFDHDDDRRVLEEEARILEGMSNAVIDEDSRPAFRAYVRARLAGRAAVLGWTGDHPLPATVNVGSDRDDPALARAATLLVLGELGADDATLKEADRYATAWLADPAAVDADVAQVAVRLAAHRGKEDRLTALAQVAEHGATPEIRFLAQQRSAQFDDPTVEAHALDRVLTDAVRKQDVLQVLGPAMAYIGSRQAALAWLEAHFDALRGKLAGSLARGTMGAAAWACTPSARAHAEEFFTPRAKEIESSGRVLAESLEASSLCEQLHASAAGEATKFFHGKSRK